MKVSAIRKKARKSALRNLRDTTRALYMKYNENIVKPMRPQYKVKRQYPISVCMPDAYQ